MRPLNIRPWEVVRDPPPRKPPPVKMAPEMESITAAEFDAMDCRLDYIIPKVLVEGQPCVMGGPSKSMKTSVAADLAVSVASGQNFLGEFPVARRQRVGFVSAESGKATLQETFRRICLSKGLTLASLQSELVVSTTMPKADEAAGLGALAAFARESELATLILDPAYLMFSGIADEAGNVFAMGGVLLPLAEKLLPMGITPIVCHHSRKVREQGVPKYDPLSLEDLAYAGWSEFARQWLLVNRREAYEEGTGFHRLWFKTGGSAGHAGVWGVDIVEGEGSAVDGRTWSLAVRTRREIVGDERDAKDAAKKRKAEDADQAAMQSLMSHLDACGPEGETASAWRKAVGFHPDKFNRLAARLKRDGLIESCKVDRAGRQYEGYRRVEV